jgi:hypothetical protein
MVDQKLNALLINPFVPVEDDEARARHLMVSLKRFADPFHESRLSGPQLTGESDDIATPQRDGK